MLEKVFIAEVSTDLAFDELDVGDRGPDGECKVDGSWKITLCDVRPEDEPEDLEIRALEVWEQSNTLAAPDDFRVLIRRATSHDTPETLRGDLGGWSYPTPAADDQDSQLARAAESPANDLP